MTVPSPRLTYRQHRRVRKLIHNCCNYDGGNCLLLDDGEAWPCPQRLCRSICCDWFRKAVLPTNKVLEAELLRSRETRRCIVCGAAFLPGSNRAKYCPACAVKVHRRQKARSERERRTAKRGQLGPGKAS